MAARSPRTTRPPAIPERAIQAAIIEYLRWRGFYVQRLNSGAARVESGHLIRMAAAGTPDVLAIKDGRALFVEVKRPGNKPTALQQAMMETLRGYGARCLVATSVEDLHAAGI
ncbi:MAG: VRR-NUC domain-containing protein [Chloroflexota bacterium]|nr:VRR-NUC domain-containing protein [Chloroflexota bacterium]